MSNENDTIIEELKYENQRLSKELGELHDKYCELEDESYHLGSICFMFTLSLIFSTLTTVLLMMYLYFFV